MKVGMVFPQQERCGIAQFSRDLLPVLAAAGADVVEIDSREPDGVMLKKTFGCDVVHVQYETGFFMDGRRDRFVRFMKRLGIPSVVSLHEVYETDPFVFPRENISGSGAVLRCKQLLWDYRHPLQRAAARHVKNGYGATILLVFHHYQKQLLVKKGVDASRVQVLFKPVLGAKVLSPFALPQLPLVRLGAVGFVNPSYDVPLLFESLEKLARPWTFTWIGGARDAAGRAVLDEIKNLIARHGWETRFFITGWLSQEAFDAQLAATDVVLALFRQRSTSGSIARALGAGKPVIATRLPLTEELAAGCGGSAAKPQGSLLLSECSGEAVNALIERFVNDAALRGSLFTGISTCHEEHSLNRYAAELVRLYRGVCG